MGVSMPGPRAIAEWLDEFLDVSAIEDYPGALNGLQVDGPGPVRRVGAATDACQVTIQRAVDAECQLLLVHHGLFWGGAERLVGPAYGRIRCLIENGVAVYSSHLPLDVHADVGNNALLAEALGVSEPECFGSLQGLEGIGMLGTLDLDRTEFVDRAAVVCGSVPHLIPGGPDRVQRLAVISGGGGSMIAQAAAAGADTLITGEGNHHTYHEAMELGLNVVYAGHYATETMGVRALAERVAAEFDLEQVFFDVPTGL